MTQGLLDGISVISEEMTEDMGNEGEDERIPLSAVLTVLESRVIKYGEDYLARQTFFEPYTQALMELSDSDKGRDF